VAASVVAMKPETVTFGLGAAVLALGLIVLLFTFSQAIAIAQNPGAFLDSQLGEEAQVAGPEAAFRWESNNLAVDLTDASTAGDAPLVAWEYDFGDGGTSSQPSPSYVYAVQGEYVVTLTVRDANGKTSRALATIGVTDGVQQAGNSMPDFREAAGGLSVDLNRILLPIGLTILTFLMYFVLSYIGGVITKAGWNLIRPRPETIRVRIKPKHLEAEPVEPVATPPPSSGEGPPPPPSR
jgi:PKD repeat protein